MASPILGPILTHTPDPSTLRRALTLMRADLLKVAGDWGLAGGWTPATRAEVAGMCGTFIFRTLHGDPAAHGGAHPYPYANQVLDETAPWGRARADVVIELGNEPMNGPRPLDPHEYLYHLNRVIPLLRAAHPRSRLLGPAFSLHDPANDAEVARWLTILRPAYLACRSTGGGVAIHAYTPGQLARAVDLVRRHVDPNIPLWLTEVNLGEAMPATERGRRLWALIRSAPVVAACLYHLDDTAAAPSEEQGPAFYRLQADTLAALGLRDDGLGAPAPAPPARPTVVSVPMTRERLSRGRPLGPPRVLVMHATAGRGPGDLGWLRKGGGDPPLHPVSCHYYISKAGRISQLVADHDTAWHCGPSAWVVDGKRVEGSYEGVSRLNWLALGIELENLNTGRDPYPTPQLQAAVALARYLVHTYQIPRAQLVRHLDISPGRKTDPANFPWGSFVSDVYLGGA